LASDGALPSQYPPFGSHPTALLSFSWQYIQERFKVKVDYLAPLNSITQIPISSTSPSSGPAVCSALPDNQVSFFFVSKISSLQVATAAAARWRFFFLIVHFFLAFTKLGFF
jgi:hypothetical protein